MPYENVATSTTPALILYLLDVSGSMSNNMGGKRRIDVVFEALQSTVRQMVFRSTKGKTVSPRYRIAMYAYSDKVWDILDGVKTIQEVASLGNLPELSTQSSTDTIRAFLAAEKLLKKELPNMQNCPAPLVCHITDGEFTGENPIQTAQRIMQMSVPDGNVLVENIFITDKLLPNPIQDVQSWEGISAATPLVDQYGITLRSISSPLPTSYQIMMAESNYHLKPEAVMMLPGMTPELVAMGLVMSGSTKV
jgi:hypothetical protein